ncbi:MAG: hypothetical protein H6817_04130 [Phycisphaerales bacterium]|nr:hypothetical protein [Phycisphaerales bacterium]
MKATLEPTQAAKPSANAPPCGGPYRGADVGVSLPVYRDAATWCPQQRHSALHARRSRRRMVRVLIPVVALVVFSALFVGADLLERYFADKFSMGVRHAVLTGLATIIAGLLSAGVYKIMRRQQQQLAKTATQLTELLEAYQEHPESAGRFENPHLLHCREVLPCERRECVMFDSPGERCWQALALRHPGGDNGQPLLSIKQCQTCDVYRMSCPDELTELGEGINNLFYLLEKGAGQIGRMRDQMVEKQKMAAVGQIASGAAHEIFNPLSSISAVVQMLRRRNQLAEHAEQFDTIETHIQRISRIVRQLADLTGSTPRAWERVDLGKTLDEVAEFASLAPQSRGIEIDYHRAEQLPETFGRAGDLHQMVLHLVLNALDAMPHGGTMTLRARAIDGRIVISVGDTGIGIAGEIGRRVFEPFFTTKEPGHGTGLGLTVTYGIVQEHGGTIEFVSDPGAGTTFTVEIPVLPEPPDEHHG